MDPGERFTLIRSIYATFTTNNDWGWHLVDAALDEFGAEEFVDDDHLRATLERLRTLSDDRLVALNSHVHPDESDPGAIPEHRGEGPWADDTFRLFISHTSANKVLAGTCETRSRDGELRASLRIRRSTQHKSGSTRSSMRCEPAMRLSLS